MKSIRTILLIWAVLLAAIDLAAQDCKTEGPRFSVRPVELPFSIDRNAMLSALSLEELNPYFEKDWIREYNRVVLTTMHDGKTKQSFSRDDVLTQEQKAHLRKADPDAGIHVSVLYIPDNDLKSNDQKEIEFTLTQLPSVSATFPGGDTKLKCYVMASAINEIDAQIFSGMKLSIIRFAIDAHGQPVDVHLQWASGDEKTDSLLLETVRNMPAWKPALDNEGNPVRQEFAFMVGNEKSCAANLVDMY